jgi:iron complex outermembrane recepter protein
VKYRAIYAALFLIPYAVIAQEEVSVLGEVEVLSNVENSFTSDTVQIGAFRGVDPIDVPQATDVITRELLDVPAQWGHL